MLHELYNKGYFLLTICTLDTAYILYDGETLIHYNDSRVDEVDVEIIDSAYIQVPYCP